MHSLEEHPVKFKHKKLIFMGIGPLIILIIASYIYASNRHFSSTDDAYIQLGTIQISPQINGLVDIIHVKNNQTVKKGDALFTIEQRPYKIALSMAQASLDTVQNQLYSAKSSYFALKAEVEAAQEDLAYFQMQYERAKGLVAAKAISQSDYDKAKRALDDAKSSLIMHQQQMQQQLDMLDNDANAPIEQHALYKQALAGLEKAQFDMSCTEVTASFDGIVSNFYLKKGSYAMMAYPVFSLIDTNDIYIEANFKETELAKIRVGQKAIIEIDSVKGKSYEAIVESITPATGSEFSILPAQNSSGNWVKVTQRVMVRLHFTNLERDLMLSSGMSVWVNIDTKNT